MQLPEPIATTDIRAVDGLYTVLVNEMVSESAQMPSLGLPVTGRVARCPAIARRG